MIEETYSPTFLASRTLPVEGVALARQLGWVRVAAINLAKSVVKTPMSGGKVDYDAVPSGASVWVTVKDESSPMHGRPILITKRPDGHFALEGGSGVSHWHDDPERERKIAARRHMVLNVKHPQEAEAAKARQAPDAAKAAAKNDERATARVARDDAARQTRAAVGIQDQPRLDRKSRDTIAETATGKLQEHGLSPEEAQSAAKYVPAAVQEAKGRVLAHHVAARVDAAHAVTGGRLARTDDHQPAQDQRSSGYADRADDLPAHGASSVAVSHAPIAEAVRRAKSAKGGDLSQPEMEQTVKEAVHSQVDNKLGRDTAISGAANAVKPNFIDKYDGKSRYDDTYDGPRWTYGLNLRPLDPFGMPKGFIYQSDRPSDQFRHGTVDYPYKLSKEDADHFSLTPAGQSQGDGSGDLPIADIPAWKPSSPEEATNAVKTFQREAEARGFKAGDLPSDDVAMQGQQTVPARSIDRTLVDAEGLSDTAYDALMDQYRQSARAPSVGAFYKAIGEHWADARQYAASLSGHVSAGAGRAWDNMTPHGMSGGGIDVPKLVDKIGVEAAAHVMAASVLQDQATPEKIDGLVKNLTTSNATAIGAIEQAALERHAGLQKDAARLESDLDDGHGDDHAARLGALGPAGIRARAETQRLYAENINAQRATLGGALGHMQFRATFLDALSRFARAAKAGTGSVGTPVALTFGDDEQAADEAASAMRLGQGAYQKLHDTRHGWTLQVDATRLKGYAQKLGQQDATAARQQAIQADESPAHDYRVPGQADTVDDGQGGQAKVAWTPMQRNDIDFLHGGGGGVLAGSRGGGKRVAALGWAARQIADNPRFKGIVTTDQGGADAWSQLAKERFPEMRVTAIPPDAGHDWVDSALQDMPHWPNGLLIVGHHQLSQRAQDQLSRLADGGHIQGHVIDSPPTEGWGRTKHLTDHANEISQISAHADGIRRVALTDHHPVEQPQLATQLASWTHPDEFTGQDHKRARDAGEHLGQPTPANDEAIQRQVVKNLAARVASEPFARPAPPAEDPAAARRRLSRETKKAKASPSAPTEEEQLRGEWHDELERAVQTGNDDEAQAILGMAPHYGWGADEAALAHQKLKGAAFDEGENRRDSAEMDQIENSPYFSVFHHFNKDSRLKKVNPYTGKKLLGRDERTGKLGQSTAEPWEMEGGGYDQVASEALSSFEGGHSQKYGMDSGDFWREATKAHKRYNELRQRLTVGRTLASQRASAVGGGAEKRKEIRGIFARRPDKEVDAPTGEANTPVGMLPGTPKLAVGGADYTPITAQPEDLAGGNVAPTNKVRPVQQAAPAPAPAPSPEPFKLQMQYGGLKPGQVQAQKEEDAGQQRMGMDVPQVRARKGDKAKAPERRKVEFDSPHRMTKDDWVGYRMASDRKNGMEPDRARHEARHREFVEQAVAQNEDVPDKVAKDYPDVAEYQKLKDEGADRGRAIRKHEGDNPNLRDFGDGPDRFDKYDEAIRKHREEHGTMVADQERRVARRNELREQIAGKHVRKSLDRITLVRKGVRKSLYFIGGRR